jgi:hypothetical protein
MRKFLVAGAAAAVLGLVGAADAKDTVPKTQCVGIYQDGVNRNLVDSAFVQIDAKRRLHVYVGTSKMTFPTLSRAELGDETTLTGIEDGTVALYRLRKYLENPDTLYIKFGNGASFSGVCPSAPPDDPAQQQNLPEAPTAPSQEGIIGGAK